MEYKAISQPARASNLKRDSCFSRRKSNNLVETKSKNKAKRSFNTLEDKRWAATRWVCNVRGYTTRIYKGQTATGWHLLESVLQKEFNLLPAQRKLKANSTTIAFCVSAPLPVLKAALFKLFNLHNLNRQTQIIPSPSTFRHFQFFNPLMLLWISLITYLYRLIEQEVAAFWW